MNGTRWSWARVVGDASLAIVALITTSYLVFIALPSYASGVYRHSGLPAEAFKNIPPYYDRPSDLAIYLSYFGALLILPVITYVGAIALFMAWDEISRLEKWLTRVGVPAAFLAVVVSWPIGHELVNWIMT